MQSEDDLPKSTKTSEAEPKAIGTPEATSIPRDAQKGALRAPVIT